ncbi:hypothetical protein ASPACDRAFT_47745 [Aspergillus aculeatus ATCC 16872]|uniref:Uncharacterized protein n=1 Tax=Aspergillus aculeatus (strain ATCC 16872 / CBS 172.66 / WB 5094) TaxID=690307 RepID=A0A1L9WGT1_ASPA1|nr:uncharacterized protein ASPACDRAFT_47745 [Aspergillus aculeatus ATCC 16872]OJJ95391.1 hypothetical protein ASPACDRAFT_47745 [Aspergillus aculeatus ATCC 16872]
MDPGSSLDYNTRHGICSLIFPMLILTLTSSSTSTFRLSPGIISTFSRLWFTLRTLRVLQVRDGSTLQVVLVKVVNDHLANMLVVAKFYNSLYYNHRKSGVDPFRCVEEEYTRETAIYQHLHKHGLSDYISQFCGLYSLDTPVPNRGMRQVLLILVDFMSGFQMDRLRPGRLAVETRQHIMEQIVRAGYRF